MCETPLLIARQRIMPRLIVHREKAVATSWLELCVPRFLIAHDWALPRFGASAPLGLGESSPYPTNPVTKACRNLAEAAGRWIGSVAFMAL